MPEDKPTARIRATPEDFEVEELPLYAPSGQGEHLYVTFRKRGLDTLTAVERLAAALGAQARDAGTAGLKDRHAVTTQTASFSFPLARELPTLEALSSPELVALSIGRHGNKLRTGHLSGNRFRLRLREVDEARRAGLVAALLELGRTGVPNRFGVQRFGASGDNAAEARAWMRGETRPPRSPRVKRLQFSALQSELFHRVLDRRIAEGTFGRLLVGDLAVRGLSSRVSLVRDPEAEAGDGEATGPIYGAKMSWPEGAPGELERAVLGEAGGDRELLDRFRTLGEGARRALRLVPRELRAAEIGGEPGSLQVEFVLPKGGYATSVLEAVCMVRDETRRPGGYASAARAEDEDSERGGPPPTHEEPE